ncbi:unnamed protein product [Rodentolepis nana]|uniref:Aldo_ket_red domain-containing protein n=1 Tax=Rodentolepis nana TaxID=102285 RepID=A0A158QI43_RODNA|nr:unnamed protein product [Rodentolepis nana]
MPIAQKFAPLNNGFRLPLVGYDATSVTEVDKTLLCVIDSGYRFLHCDADDGNSENQMEQLVDAGFVRSLGLSNFSRDQIDRLIRFCNIKPVVLQMNSSILTYDRELKDYAQSFGIQVIVNDTNSNQTPVENAFLENEVVLKMAKNYLKNPYQILIRRAIQRDLIVFCCSTDPYRIRTNMSVSFTLVFEFELSPDEMAKLDEVEESVHRQ